MIPLTFFSRNKDEFKQMQQQRILTKQNGQFLWFLILIELMSNKTASDDESREGIKDLVDGLRQYFETNEVQLQKINNFETNYSKWNRNRKINISDSTLFKENDRQIEFQKYDQNKIIL
jgi:hypothetical protein